MGESRISGVTRLLMGFGLLTVVGCGGVADTDDEALASSLDALRFHHATTPRWARVALRAGAERLCDLQADRTEDNAGNGLDDADPEDGGWDWLLPLDATEHLPGDSPENLYGATALGLWAARQALGFDARYVTAQRDAASGAALRPEVDSPPDFVYLVLLAEQTRDRSYAELARARYDARRALAGSATAYATSILEQRHENNADGLIAYDLTWLALGARALAAAFPRQGYGRDADDIASVVAADLGGSPGYFDRNDPTERYYTQGLAWSLVALANAPGDASALRGEVTGALLALATDDGGWGWSGDYPAADLQATAHVVQAFALTRRHPPVAAQRAARWLAAAQLASGGFAYVPGQGAPLLDAEILLALRLIGDGRHANSFIPRGPIAFRRNGLGEAGSAPGPSLSSPL